MSSSGKVGTPIHHRSAKKSIRRASRELQRVRRKKRRWRGAVRRCLHELNNQKPEREWVQRCRELVKISGSVREIYCWEGCVATLLNCKLDRGEALQLSTQGMHLWLTRFSHFISVLIALHLHCHYANHACCVFCTLLKPLRITRHLKLCLNCVHILVTRLIINPQYFFFCSATATSCCASS